MNRYSPITILLFTLLTSSAARADLFGGDVAVLS